MIVIRLFRLCLNPSAWPKQQLPQLSGHLKESVMGYAHTNNGDDDSDNDDSSYSNTSSSGDNDNGDDDDEPPGL